jgi:PRTRC genetic system protein E
METNFFQQVAGLKVTGNIRLNIQPQDDGTMTVSLLLVNESVKDKGAGKIPPLILKGNIEELDRKFFETITSPIQKTSALLCNMKEHEQALKTAQNASSTKSSSGSGNKDKDAKRRGFDEQMKKVTDLEKLGKVGEAIGQLPDSKSYPEYAEEIKAKMQQLRSKHGTLSLFGEAEAEETPVLETGNQEPEDAADNREDNVGNEDDDIDDDDDGDFDQNEDDLDPNK